MKLYAISGLGADKRVFEYLTLDSEIVHLDWIRPKKNEKIEDYALRLSQKINENEKFGIIGISFGGLVAVEISKITKPEISLLVSSAETKKELRSIYKGFGKTKLIKLIPEKLFDMPRGIAKFLFGTKKTELLNKILDDTDLEFTKWAVEKLITWDNEEKIKNCIKINGTKDKLIPASKEGNVKLIDGGEHFMIVDRASEISDIINNEIKQIK